MQKTTLGGAVGAILAVISSGAWAACSDVSVDQLSQAIQAANSAGSGPWSDPTTGGYGLPMWATIVDETGMVCQVQTSGYWGGNAGNQEWLGSRVISAQKANTANAFSTDYYAISTANLYSAVQPGGSLYGLQHSNPVDASTAYLGSPAQYGLIDQGKSMDPLVGRRIGGINVFGGGLALYKFDKSNNSYKKIGALGVSGDTACRDHAYAWRIREALRMHAGGNGITTANYDADGAGQTPLFPKGLKGDEMIIVNKASNNYWNTWSHPACPDSTKAITRANGTLKVPYK